jgi:hypothetical protein
VESHQNKFTEDISKASARASQMTETIESQQKQLMRYLSKQNKINQQVRDELKTLQETQSHQQTMISTLQAVVLSIKIQPQQHHLAKSGIGRNTTQITRKPPNTRRSKVRLRNRQTSPNLHHRQ